MKGHYYNHVSNVILAAHALPMFREPRQRSTRKQLEKDRLDPLKSHKPEPPVAGPGDCLWLWPVEGGRGQGIGTISRAWVLPCLQRDLYQMDVLRHFLCSVEVFAEIKIQNRRAYG